MTGARSQGRPEGPRRRAGVVLAAVRPVAERVASGSGVALWDVAFEREAGRETLRVAVDRKGGIDSDGLSRFAAELSRELDASEAVPGDERYWLEVTSPGAERRLATPEQFRICSGRHVRLTFHDGRQPVEQAVIVSADDEAVEVDVPGDGPVRVSFVDIAQARLRVPGA